MLTRSRLLLPLLAAAVAVPLALPSAAAPPRRAGAAARAACVGDPSVVQRLDLTVAGEPAFGLYALPRREPRGMVVFAHGYGHTVESWRRHLARTAARLNVVAVAMNYRGQIDSPPAQPGALPTSRGWQVQEGAEDSIAAAHHFERACRGVANGTIVMYGVSMGFNTAGLAVAARPRRTTVRRPLFDWLIDVEGAANVVETYFEARTLAVTGNAYAVGAVQDIEREMGGPFEARHETYLERTVVNRVDDIAAAGLKGVFVVHGVGDGLVPYNQSRELVTLLRAAGVPVHMTTYATRSAGSEPGTTADGYVLNNVPGWTSPFAGHASEASETHDVGVRGFQLLDGVFSGARPCGETVEDGGSGQGADASVC